jgi:hypothetical protein
MSVVGISKFESLFRKEGSLDIDKNDVRKIYDFTNNVIHRLLQVGIKNASINGRDVVWTTDLPITEGLENSIKEFEALDSELDLSGILEAMTKLPPLKYEIGEDIELMLPKLSGGIVIAFIKAFKTVEPKKKNPQTQDWEKIEAIFETLL